MLSEYTSAVSLIL